MYAVRQTFELVLYSTAEHIAGQVIFRVHWYHTVCIIKPKFFWSYYCQIYLQYTEPIIIEVVRSEFCQYCRFINKSLAPKFQKARQRKIKLVAFVLYCTITTSIIHLHYALCTNQTLPGRELLNYSRPGRVWLVTSRLGTGKTITFFYSVIWHVMNPLCRAKLLQG
jgi:hypothetical protein